MMIRRAHEDDLSTMVELLCELFRIEDDFTIDREKHFKGLQRLIHHPDAIVLVVEECDKVIGMATVQKLISTVMGEYVGLIEDVIISKEYRGRGIGKILIEELITESTSSGMVRLSLGADRRNQNAIHFYTASGFKESHMGLMYYLPRVP